MMERGQSGACAEDDDDDGGRAAVRRMRRYVRGGSVGTLKVRA